jgi:hypothetical protein
LLNRFTANNSFKPTPHRGVGHLPTLRWYASADPLQGGLARALASTEDHHMLLRISTGLDGISIALGETTKSLERSSSASQQSPQGCYVYGHYDRNGVPFYIGKGKGRRAWNGDRHLLWHRYVNKHINGLYSVVILHDNLSSEDAEELESAWISQESETLVNWINFGRKTDFKALERFHSLRKEALDLIAKGRSIEATDIKTSVELYRQALKCVDIYSRIQPEQGLIGRLIDEERNESGLRGELSALDRLTICLCKLGHGAVALEASDDYFAAYRADSSASQAARIKKRVLKAVSRAG